MKRRLRVVTVTPARLCRRRSSRSRHAVTRACSLRACLASLASSAIAFGPCFDVGGSPLGCALLSATNFGVSTVCRFHTHRHCSTADARPSGPAPTPRTPKRRSGSKVGGIGPVDGCGSWFVKLNLDQKMRQHTTVDRVVDFDHLPHYNAPPYPSLLPCLLLPCPLRSRTNERAQPVDR